MNIYTDDTIKASRLRCRGRSMKSTPFSGIGPGALVPRPYNLARLTRDFPARTKRIGNLWNSLEEGCLD